MKKLMYFCVLIFMSQFSKAQIIPNWIATEGGIPSDFYWVNDMTTDKAGNSCVFAYEEDSVQGLIGLIIKYNTDGTKLWENTLPGIGPYGKIKTDKIGNVYVIVRFDTVTSASDDYLTIKYNSNGDLKWKRIYNGPYNGTDMPNSIAIDDSLNVYVNGFISRSNFSDFYYATVKYDSSGQQKWVSIYNTNYVNSSLLGDFIALDAFHNIYVIGSINDTLNLPPVLVIKYNSDGNQIWAKRYANGNMAETKFIDISVDGFIYVGGSDCDSGNGTDYFCKKIDSAGNEIWTSKYNAQDTLPWNGNEIPRAMKLDKAGNVYMGGTQNWSAGEDDDYCLVKFNRDGILKWARSYTGGAGWDDIFSIGIDSKGYVCVLGTSEDIIAPRGILTTIRYDSTGSVSWIAKFYGSQVEQYSASALGLDSNNNVYISGSCQSQYSPHFVTLKYLYGVGVTEITGENHSKLYPNPSNDIFILEFNYKPDKTYSFVLYDFMGQIIQIIDDVNSNKLIIKGGNLAKGVYFYQLLENEVKIAEGKMIKL